MGRSTHVFVAARRRFRCSIKVEVPGTGLGMGLTELRAWLTGRLGADGHELVPDTWDGRRDAMAILFNDPAMAPEIAEWCARKWPLTPG